MTRTDRQILLATRRLINEEDVEQLTREFKYLSIRRKNNALSNPFHHQNSTSKDTLPNVSLSDEQTSTLKDTLLNVLTSDVQNVTSNDTLPDVSHSDEQNVTSDDTLPDVSLSDEQNSTSKTLPKSCIKNRFGDNLKRTVSFSERPEVFEFKPTPVYEPLMKRRRIEIQLEHFLHPIPPVNQKKQQNKQNIMKRTCTVTRSFSYRFQPPPPGHFKY